MRDLLSLKEVVVLANVPEGRVRKDIETGILSKPHVVRLADSRLCFEWFHVFMVAAVYGNEHLDPKLRKIAISRIETFAVDDDYFFGWRHPEVLSCCGAKTPKEFVKSVVLDRFICLDLGLVSHHVMPRVGVYSGGLRRIEEKDDILGGEAVFKDTRLPVSHVGKMVESGEKIENILEDYPYLNEHDVQFAALYFRAHPVTGRPRGGGDKCHGASST